MGGEYIICLNHNFEGIAKYGECPYCKRETEEYAEKHPVIMPEDILNFSREEYEKVKRIKEINEVRKNRTNIGGLIRHMYSTPVRLEYDSGTREIKDTTGKVWFKVVKDRKERTQVNITGYDLVDAYNNRLNIIPSVIKYIPDPTIPLEPDERKEMETKIRGLEQSLNHANENLVKWGLTRADLFSKLINMEMEIKKGNSPDPEYLLQMINDYLNRHR